MKDSKDKEHRISNLKDMIDNVKEDEKSEFDEIEEDSELINYLNEDNTDYEKLGIDDEFIYHPGDEDHPEAIDLEESQIDEDFIIKAPNTEDIEENDEYDEYSDDFVGEFSENFDNVVNAKIRGRPVLAFVSLILGVIFIVISIFIFQSRSDRVVDNVVAGESSFMFVIFLIVGLFLLVYGIFKIFNVKNPLEKMTNSIDSIDSDKKDDDHTAKKEEPSEKTIPKSKIPLDKDSYKIGEFDAEDLKTTLKKPTDSQKNKPPVEQDYENLPPAKEKSPENKGLTSEEIEERDYEQVKLESESIDDIFAEVEDIEDLPIISIDSEKK